jgi:hypothetical protein
MTGRKFAKLGKKTEKILNFELIWVNNLLNSIVSKHHADSTPMSTQPFQTVSETLAGESAGTHRKARSLGALLTHKQTRGDREGLLAEALALQNRQKRSLGSEGAGGVTCSSADRFEDPS